MNAIDTRAISHYVPGPARWQAAAAVPPGRGLHFGVILLALLVLGGLAFGVSRMRRGHTRQHDDQWGRPEPPPASPSPPGPPRLAEPPRHAAPPGPAGPPGPAPPPPAPDAAPNGDTRRA